jgi:hypothetical protein
MCEWHSSIGSYGAQASPESDHGTYFCKIPATTRHPHLMYVLTILDHTTRRLIVNDQTLENICIALRSCFSDQAELRDK